MCFSAEIFWARRVVLGRGLLLAAGAGAAASVSKWMLGISESSIFFPLSNRSICL